MGDENAFKHLIGKKLVDNTSKGHEGATAPDDNHFLQSSLPVGCRVLHPDSFATMDFRPDRMNVYVDANNVVLRIAFG